MLRKFNNKHTKPLVIDFYRRAVRLTLQLEANHKKIWYDYLRLKLEENAQLNDEKRIKLLLSEGEESLQWMLSILKRKTEGQNG